MNDIRAGRPKPTGVDPDAWLRLVAVSKSENFKKKSAAMKYANSCWHNLGRTRPGGEIGVRESLKYKMGRSPDPEEIQAEMTRDKGYGGKKRKTKQKAGPEKILLLTSGREEDNQKHSQCENDIEVEDIAGSSQRKVGRSGGEDDTDILSEQMKMFKKMEAEIADLKARLESTVGRLPHPNKEAQVRSMAGAHTESSFERLMDQVRSWSNLHFNSYNVIV